MKSSKVMILAFMDVTQGGGGAFFSSLAGDQAGLCLETSPHRKARKIPQEMAHLVVRSVSLLTASGRLYTHEEKWFFGFNSPQF